MANELILVCVAFLWGATNPFIRKGSVGICEIKCDSKIKRAFHEIKFLFTRWQVCI